MQNESSTAAAADRQSRHHSTLAADAIRQRRDAFGMLAEVEVVETTGSTNTDLMNRLPGLERAVMRIALHQTAGRGRAGRSWSSVPDGMLMFSLAWPMKQASHQLMGLPLAVGVMIAEVLNSLDVNVRLKWPNDVLRNGNKLAGILIESAAQPEQGSWIVVGIGLNLLIPDTLESELGRTVADAPWLARMDRNQLAAMLLNALARGLDQFEREGFSGFLQRWNALHAYAGQAVLILDQGQVVRQGIALCVDTTGCLLLQTEQGQVSILAGDVSLRPAD
ncbi:biotin--[acetyl-CoA-carboxylase] ligase [Undibacterium griseum]|nr:biotin--[acetyl-CoA-carboxylase] ligase [Undibacterium griseum]